MNLGSLSYAEFMAECNQLSAQKNRHEWWPKARTALANQVREQIALTKAQLKTSESRSVCAIGFGDADWLMSVFEKSNPKRLWVSDPVRSVRESCLTTIKSWGFVSATVIDAQPIQSLIDVEPMSSIGIVGDAVDIASCNVDMARTLAQNLSTRISPDGLVCMVHHDFLELDYLSVISSSNAGFESSNAFAKFESSEAKTKPISKTKRFTVNRLINKSKGNVVDYDIALTSGRRSLLVGLASRVRKPPTNTSFVHDAMNEAGFVCAVETNLGVDSDDEFVNEFSRMFKISIFSRSLVSLL